MSRPDCDQNMLVCPAIAWADEEIERLRAEIREMREMMWMPVQKPLPLLISGKFANVCCEYKP